MKLIRREYSIMSWPSSSRGIGEARSHYYCPLLSLQRIAGRERKEISDNAVLIRRTGNAGS